MAKFAALNYNIGNLKNEASRMESILVDKFDNKQDFTCRLIILRLRK